jgi:uncharacterized protein
MPTVKDVIVRKPSDKEIQECKRWPIWSKKASTFDWVYSETETCLILEGEVTVSDAESSVTFGAGDLVIFPNELKCTWRITKQVRKHYNFS